MNYKTTMDKIYFTKDHEYVKFNEDCTVHVGISDYAQSELGEIVFVDIPTVGEEVKQFNTFGSIEAVKTVADLNMPITGCVEEYNEELENHPELVNEDPYGDGWIISINVNEASDEFGSLMNEEEYKEYIATL